MKLGCFDMVETIYGNTPDVLSQLIRTMLIPKEGCEFIVADFSAIEARVLAWEAGEDWRLEAFLEGKDIYCASASQMFHVPVVKHGINGELRQKGKVAELACGYHGDLSLDNGKETNEILCRLKGRLYLIRGNHDERYLRDKDFDISRFEWVKDYVEIHDNKRKIVLMHYPIFCYNGQFRRGADGTPLTYMLHGHIHKSEDQVLVDKFCAETRATMRKSGHQETAQPVPCQMINCFCMYSAYMPLTLEEWIECDQRRRNKADCG